MFQENRFIFRETPKAPEAPEAPTQPKAAPEANSEAVDKARVDYEHRLNRFKAMLRHNLGKRDMPALQPLDAINRKYLRALEVSSAGLNQSGAPQYQAASRELDALAKDYDREVTPIFEKATEIARKRRSAKPAKKPTERATFEQPEEPLDINKLKLGVRAAIERSALSGEEKVKLLADTVFVENNEGAEAILDQLWTLGDDGVVQFETGKGERNLTLGKMYPDGILSTVNGHHVDFNQGEYFFAKKKGQKGRPERAIVLDGYTLGFQRPEVKLSTEEAPAAPVEAPAVEPEVEPASEPVEVAEPESEDGIDRSPALETARYNLKIAKKKFENSHIAFEEALRGLDSGIADGFRRELDENLYQLVRHIDPDSPANVLLENMFFKKWPDFQQILDGALLENIQSLREDTDLFNKAISVINNLKLEIPQPSAPSTRIKMVESIPGVNKPQAEVPKPAKTPSEQLSLGDRQVSEKYEQLLEMFAKDEGIDVALDGFIANLRQRALDNVSSFKEGEDPAFMLATLDTLRDEYQRKRDDVLSSVPPRPADNDSDEIVPGNVLEEEAGELGVDQDLTPEELEEAWEGEGSEAEQADAEESLEQAEAEQGAAAETIIGESDAWGLLIEDGNNPELARPLSILESNIETAKREYIEGHGKEALLIAALDRAVVAYNQDKAEIQQIVAQSDRALGEVRDAEHEKQAASVAAAREAYGAFVGELTYFARRGELVEVVEDFNGRAKALFDSMSKEKDLDPKKAVARFDDLREALFDATHDLDTGQSVLPEEERREEAPAVAAAPDRTGGEPELAVERRLKDLIAKDKEEFSENPDFVLLEEATLGRLRTAKEASDPEAAIREATTDYEESRAPFLKRKT